MFLLVFDADLKKSLSSNHNEEGGLSSSPILSC